MLSNFAFTLYEIFGYFIPGGIAFSALATLYWALFNGPGPLRVASFNPQVGTWALLLGACYILGHAAQALGNLVLRNVEERAMEMESSPTVRQSARKAAASILGQGETELKSRWVYRALDEYAVQNGNAGDRDMFIYREGFYRGTCVALFFLAACLAVRVLIPGTSVIFASWTMYVQWYEFAFTIVIIVVIGLLFLQRYRRFAEYRVTRAALAALVLIQKNASDSGSSLAVPKAEADASTKA